jgi:hypothetical protein
VSGWVLEKLIDFVCFCWKTSLYPLLVIALLLFSFFLLIDFCLDFVVFCILQCH